MSKRQAIFSARGLKRGFANFPLRGFGRASVREAVHDGDTVSVQPDGNLSTRFLGIDTCEMSYIFPQIDDPNAGRWVSIRKFVTYLSDPFSDQYPDSVGLRSKLGEGLVGHLTPLLGPDCATKHYKYALRAQRALEELIIAEYKERAEKGRQYRFFIAFSHEVMDGHGRLLCYLHRDNNKRERERDPLSYNEKMLERGMAFPYFIWPNVDPFRPKSTYVEAVPEPDELQDWVQSAERLNQAREIVREAREKRLGIFEEGDLLAPFELRFLARRRPPHRYVLNLETCANVLLRPTQYYLIGNPEDQLFIDEHFLPLFEEKGYEVSTG